MKPVTKASLNRSNTSNKEEYPSSIMKDSNPPYYLEFTEMKYSQSKKTSNGISNEPVIKSYLNKTKKAQDVVFVTMNLLKQCPLLADKEILYNNILLLSLQDLHTTNGILKLHSTMITAYGNAGQWEKAERIYTSIPANNCDIVIHNAMITAYGNAGQWEKAQYIYYNSIPADDYNIITHNAMITAYGNAGQSEEAERIYTSIPANNLDIITYNAMITAYRNDGQWEKAERIYTSIPANNRNRVTNSAMITVYDNAGQWEKAERIYTSIPANNRNRVTNSAMITAYGNAGQWEKAERIYTSIPANNRDIVFHGAMITAYGNAGQWKKAERIYTLIPANNRNIVIYNAIITAYGNAEQWEKAILFFEDMLSKETGIFQQDRIDSDITDLHQNKVFTATPNESHATGVSLALAKVILLYKMKHKIKISQIIVGQHGNDILKEGILDFIKQHGLDAKVDLRNLGRIKVMTTKSLQESYDSGIGAANLLDEKKEDFNAKKLPANRRDAGHQPSNINRFAALLEAEEKDTIQDSKETNVKPEKSKLDVATKVKRRKNKAQTEGDELSSHINEPKPQVLSKTFWGQIKSAFDLCFKRILKG